MLLKIMIVWYRTELKKKKKMSLLKVTVEILKDKSLLTGVLCHFQQYFRHITKTAHIIHVFHQY